MTTDTSTAPPSQLEIHDRYMRACSRIALAIVTMANKEQAAGSRVRWGWRPAHAEHTWERAAVLRRFATLERPAVVSTFRLVAYRCAYVAPASEYNDHAVYSTRDVGVLSITVYAYGDTIAIGYDLASPDAHANGPHSADWDWHAWSVDLRAVNEVEDDPRVSAIVEDALFEIKRATE